MLGFLGVAAMIFTDVMGALARPRYDALADTISVLAAHKLTGIQDIGLFLLALGGLACGVGLLLWLPPGPRRILSGVLLLLAGISVAVLTIADVRTAHPTALTVHEDASLAVGASILVASLAFAFSVRRAQRGYRTYSLACAAALIVLGSLFAAVPSRYLGLYERLLVADGLAWLGMVSYALVRGERHA